MSEPAETLGAPMPHRTLFTTKAGYGYEDYLVFVIFWALAVTVFSQFFSRYVLNDSIAWTEEIARFLLVAVTFLGIPIGIRKGSHIMIEVFHRFVPRRMVGLVTVVAAMISLAFYVYGTYLAFLVMNLVKNQRISSFDISKSVLYGFVVAGFVLMVLRSVEAIWLQIRDVAGARRR